MTRTAINFLLNHSYKFIWIAAVLCFFLLPGHTKAQYYNGSQMTFGKNRVQYKEFIWTYYKFEKYDVYFYLGGKELALFTSKFATDYLAEAEDKLGTTLEDKIQFIIFNNLSELKQSNIGLVSNEQYNTGGVTHIIGNKVFLYFDGTYTHFKTQVKAGISRSVINQLLFGGSIGSQIKNASLFPYPSWFIEGLVSYLSEGWNTNIDNRVRDGFLTGRFKKINNLSGEDAVYAGHAFWNYIVETYGEANLSNILYMAKVSRKVENGFLYVLAVSVKKLMQDCNEYYINKYSDTPSSVEPEGEPLKIRSKSHMLYSQLRISPDGGYAAYTSNNSGLYKVHLYDFGRQKQKKILRFGFRLDEKTDESYPLLRWHPSGKILAMILERKGEIFLYMYTPEDRKTVKVQLFQFQKVTSFDYSPDGRFLVLSAVQFGQSDIYLYNLGSNTFEQLTKDHFDDIHPVFLKENDIVFSSNRKSELLKFEDKYIPAEVENNYDIYRIRKTDYKPYLRQITDSPLANETMPEKYEDNYITFLSDENGINNRYLARFDSVISFVDTTTHYRYFTLSMPITNYNRSVIGHDFSSQSGKFGQVVFRDNRYMLLTGDKLPAREMQAPQLDKTSFVKKLEENNQKNEAEKADSTKTNSKKKRFGFYTVRESDRLREAGVQDTAKQSQALNINNYTFDKQVVKQKVIGGDDYTMIESPLPGQKNKEEEFAPKRLNYNVQYFLSDIVSQVDFSYLNANYQPFTGGTSPIYLNPGFNLLFKIGVTDLLEDYRITGGVRLNLDLINNEYLLSIANLKHRLDKEIVLHRQVVENFDFNEIVRVYSHEAYYMMTWPFNPVMSIKGTATFRSDMGVYLSIDDRNLRKPNTYANWLGLRGEFIYDATRNLGLNLYEGTRFKIFTEYYQLMDELDRSLMTAGFDYRNYQRIHKTFIWANRFATGTSFGHNKVIYYMGGVDNWLTPSFIESTPIDFSQNYTYQTLATNMRGFKQNIRNGNTFAVINSELRFPVFRYFLKRPLRSDFLNNMQIIGFGDIGTAWTGFDPYSEENYLYTTVIKQNPLNIRVQVQKEPVVGGYGLGLRSRLLGYFIRADYAWGIEDGKVQTGIFYFSLSLDF